MGVVLNIGGNELNASTFINVLKAAQYNFSSVGDAATLDDDGYVVSTPMATVSLSWAPSATFTNTTYKLVWPASRSNWTWQFASGGVTKIASSNATIVGGTGSNMTVTPTPGQAGWVTFSFTAGNFQNINIGLAANTYAPGSGEIALYRLSDEADYLAGEYFTPEFKTLISDLKPHALRYMGWVQTGAGNLSMDTTWACRTKLSNFTWNGRRFIPAAWSGAASGTDAYSISPASGSPASWTDGEVFQCIVTNASTSTTPTLSVTGRTGSKTVVSTFAAALSVGAIAAGGFATFVYDGLLDKMIFYGSGSNGTPPAVPVEAQAQLCNRLSVNLWATIPHMASDDYVTQWATAALNNLSSSLLFYPEYSNEIWNFSFPQTNWASARGLALGFPNSSNAPIFGWYGLRVRQVMGNLIPAVWSGRMSKLRRTLMYQGAGDTTTLNHRMKGIDLAPLGTGTGQGNATYTSWTGGANYTASPNRPIDVVEVIGYAPYAGGTNLYFGPDIASGSAPNAINATFYQALVTAWEGGDSATSLALIDADIRGGLNGVQTVTASGTTFTTPSAHGFVANSSDVAFTVSGGSLYSGLTAGAVYRVTSTPTSTTFTLQAYGQNNSPTGSNINAGSAGTGTVSVGWMGGQGSNGNIQTMQKLCSNWYVFGEWLAAQFDADRPSGMSALSVTQYEGALELVGPSAAQLTTLGVTGTTPATSITAAITAWKNSSKAAETLRAYYRQFMGLDATMPTFSKQLHSQSPAHLILQGSATYGLTPSTLPANTPYQLYYGFKNYDNGKRRMVW